MHHTMANGPATHSWEDCYVMREFRAEAIKKGQGGDPDQRQEQFGAPNQRQNPFGGFVNPGLRVARSQAVACIRCITNDGITRREPFNNHPHRGLRRGRMTTAASAITPSS